MDDTEQQKELKTGLEHIDNLTAQIESASTFDRARRLQQRLDVAKAYHSGLLRMQQLLAQPTHPVPTPVDGESQHVQLVSNNCPIEHVVDGELSDGIDKILMDAEGKYFSSQYDGQATEAIRWPARDALKQLFAAHLQAAVREARIDELQTLTKLLGLENITQKEKNVSDKIVEKRLHHLKQEGQSNE